MRTRKPRLEQCGNVHCLWQTPAVPLRFQSAVSLHSHTLHSREGLDWIPRIMRKTGIVHAAFQAVEGYHTRRMGHEIGYERAFWRPPLSPHAAWELEAAQIREKLGLQPFVSISDHDQIEACAELCAIGVPTPYSSEWTVPFGATVFHIGVHNLPADQAVDLHAAMAQYTAAPGAELLAELLAALDELPDTLVILNHPFVTEDRLDRATHVKLLLELLEVHGSRIHALELNGLQPASANCETIRLAGEVGLPVISGGDRHCLEPNANVNLTNAATFDEFVHEVRREGLSHVLFMPQYRESIASRYIEFIWHAVQEYPELPGRQRWADRIFFERREQPGVIVPLSSAWKTGGPMVVRGFISALGLLAAPRMRGALRVAFGRQGEVVA